jgi:hypothetical protein
MNTPRRLILENSRDHYEVGRTLSRIHVPTDHDRVLQERFNAQVEVDRFAGRITQLTADTLVHNYVMGGSDGSEQICGV